MNQIYSNPADRMHGKKLPIMYSVKEAGWQVGEMTSAALGFRVSFAVCAALILLGIIVAVVALPRQPEVVGDQGD